MLILQPAIVPDLIIWIMITMTVLSHKHSVFSGTMIVEKTRPAIIAEFKEEVKEGEEKSKKPKNSKTVVAATSGCPMIITAKFL